MRARHFWFSGLLFLADLAVLELAFFVIYWWRFQTGLFQNPVVFTPSEQIVPSLFVTAFWALHFSVFGLYRFDPLESRAIVVTRVAKAAVYGCLIIFLATFEPSNPLPLTRVILFTYGAGVMTGVAFSRLVLLTVLQELRLRGRLQMPTLVIGSGDRLEAAIKYLRGNRFIGARVLGVITPEQMSHLSLPVLGRTSDSRRVIAARPCELVYIALDDRDIHKLSKVVALLSELPVRQYVPGDHYQHLLGAVRPIGRKSLSMIEIRGDLLTPIELILKRAFDLFAALILLVLTLPLWLIAAILIVAESGRPLFYAQERLGLNGKRFKILKFRSMIPNAESETGPVLVTPGDARITRVGRFLRSSRIDELPQLLNILAGHMSLVGPRPERPEFAREFARTSPLFSRRQNVKPGLTGWAQVHLHYDATVSAPEKKLEMDLYYIENMSLPLDLKILYMTMFVVLRGEG